MSVASLGVLETLREISACDPRAFEPRFLVVESVVCLLLVCRRARLGLGKHLESLSIPIQRFREVSDADLVLCIEAFLLERVDVASEPH